MVSVAREHAVSTLRSLREICESVSNLHSDMFPCRSHLAALARRAVEVPPAPRLVGIETNPGPRAKVLPSLITSMITSAVKSAVSGSKKASTAVVSRKRKRARPSTASNSGFGSMAMSSAQVTAPVSKGDVMFRRTTAAGCSFPFSVTGLSVSANITTNFLYFTNLGSGYGQNSSSVQSCYPLPIQFSVQGAASLLGCGNSVLARVSQSFVFYRLRNLVITFHPLLPTNIGGQYCMAHYPDVAITDSSTPSFGNVSATAGSVTAPIWQTSAIRVPDDPTWFRNDVDNAITPATAADAYLRQLCSGSLLFAQLGVPSNPAVVTLLGTISFAGQIEFRDLADVQDL